MEIKWLPNKLNAEQKELFKKIHNLQDESVENEKNE